MRRLPDAESIGDTCRAIDLRPLPFDPVAASDWMKRHNPEGTDNVSNGEKQN